MIEFHIFKELYTKMIKWFKRNQNSEPNLDTEEQQDHAESSMESRLEEPQELAAKRAFAQRKYFCPV